MEFYMRTEIKICGITSIDEIRFLKKKQPDYVGMVLYFEKSKRNLTLQQAGDLCETAGDALRKVAVTVSPTPEQADEIYKAGFDILQVHGELHPEVLAMSKLPIIRAFQKVEPEEMLSLSQNTGICGFLFDAASPGSGKTFDWDQMQGIRTYTADKKIFLAGGLTPDNVAQAIRSVHPDAVDVSSGVENASGIGKDFRKIEQFIKNAGN